MSNFFSSPWFLAAAAEVLLPGRGVRPGTVQVEGEAFDTLVLPGGRPASLPLVDFLEARGADAPAAELLPVRWLPAVSRGRVALGPSPEETAAPPGRRRAPLVDWTRFSRWEDFVAHAHGRNGRAFGKSERKLRKISKELGPARFALDLTDHALLERMLLWKSQQLRGSGRLDRFASPRNRQLLHRLVERGHLRLSTLMAGDRPIAALLGCTEGTRYSCWVTAYDAVLGAYSPGALLFEHQMRHGWDQGQTEFDFLIGDEGYKYHYATDERHIGPLGRPPLAVQAADLARQALDPAPDARLAEGRKAARRRLFELASRVDRRRRLTPLPEAPDWQAELTASTPTWPRPRLLRPDDCQMLVLLEQAEARLSTPDKLRSLAVHTGNRLRGRTERWLLAEEAVPPQATRPPLRLAPGDWVRVRSPAEIRATLHGGELNGLYFIPDLMDRFSGQTLQVERPVLRFFDEKSRQVVRMKDTVLLRTAHCDGSQLFDRRGCDRGCLLFWHEAWLDRAEPPGSTATPAPGPRVRIKPAAEIARLAAQAPDGLPWVAATMAPFAGQVLPVARRVQHAYDERRGRVFPVADGLVLEAATCPGLPLSSGGVCDRACPLYWRADWVEEA